MLSIFGNKGDAGSGDQDGRDRQGLLIREMESRDIDAALAIIEAHDEDDAEEAEESFSENARGALCCRRHRRGGGHKWRCV